LGSELKIVLASISPRRISLRQIGMRFSVAAPVGDEASVAPDPVTRVMENALAKARSVQGEGEGLVVGADTVVYIDGTILGKPASEDEAHTVLEALSGRVHTVFTGLAVVDAGGREEVGCEETRVNMMELSVGAVFVEEVDGCFHNVVGLPLSLLWRVMRGMGYDPFSFVDQVDAGY